MKPYPRLLSHALLAGLVILVTGCKMPAKPKQFNNTIARSIKQLGDDGRRMQKAMEPLFKGDKPNPPEVSSAREACDAIKNHLASYTKEADEMKPPTNSPEGEVMLEKYREYLKKEQEIYERHFTKMLQIIQDNRYGLEDKKTTLKAMLDNVTSDERPALERLKKAQKEYCKANEMEDVTP
jgi:hypothetical protein